MERRKLAVEIDAAVDKLTGLSLMAPADERYAIHRWTAARLKEIMGRDQWRRANRLAGDYYREPEKISINYCMAAWRHCLEADVPETAHHAAEELFARLHIRGCGSLCRTICQTMLKATRDNPRLRAAWLYTTGTLDQARGAREEALALYRQALEIFENLDDPSGMAQTRRRMGAIRQALGDYDEALDLYRQSLEIKEKLDDRSGMAGSFDRMGTAIQKLGKEQEAFGHFFQAFFIFSEIQAPAASKAASHLCDTARRNPNQWRKWLSELAPDEGSRGRIEQMITGAL